MKPFLEVIFLSPECIRPLHSFGGINSGLCEPLQSEASAKWSAFYEEASRNASSFPADSITDDLTKLQIQTLQERGSSVLSTEKYNRVSR